MREATMQEKYLPDHIRYIHSRRRDDTAQNDTKRKEKRRRKAKQTKPSKKKSRKKLLTHEHGVTETETAQASAPNAPRIKDRYGMRRHFMHRHLNIIIEEEASSHDVRAAECSGATVKLTD
jgi:hypothetical protein